MKQRTFMALMVVFLATIVPSAVAGANNGVVNINTATAEQLQMLPRVGPALATRIIEFRETSGPFRSVDEIVAVRGIGESSFEMLEPYIVTSGATTLNEKVATRRSSSGPKAAD